MQNIMTAKKLLPNTEINAVLKNYDIDFTKVNITTLGNGHINRTYKITTPEESFVLQRINHDIFIKTHELTRNTQKINKHLLHQQSLGNYPLSVPQQLLTKSGNTYTKVGEYYWRLMEFIAESFTVEAVNNPEQASAVARSFAQFSRALSDFSTTELTIIIDDFHDINYRMRQLTEAVTKDSLGRLRHCQTLVDFCFGQKSFIKQVIEISRKLPLHITHNDTKINNLLFRPGNIPCAVIDLDTCMPGLLMHDFGDMVRTCCSNLAEDDKNIDSMVFNREIFIALIQSYQQVFNDKLTLLEQESLIIGAKLLPFIVATRFLSDYLNGDHYFAVNRKEQNLDRAHNQVQLFKLVSAAESTLMQFAFKPVK